MRRSSRVRKYTKLISDRYDLMLEILEDAGEKYIKFFNNLSGSYEDKKKIVSEYEEGIEVDLSASIERKFAEDGIFGEEARMYKETTNGINWIIDPLDGSNSFANGSRRASITMALQLISDNKKEIILGMVYDFFNGQLYWASEIEDCAKLKRQGRGFQTPVELDLLVKKQEATKIEKMRINSDYKILSEEDIWINDVIENIKRRCGESYETKGSVALNICQVTEGIHTMYVTRKQIINVWDYAAAIYIHQKAGGAHSLINADGEVIPLDLENSVSSILIARKKQALRNILREVKHP